jgi:hypothetical protein
LKKPLQHLYVRPHRGQGLEDIRLHGSGRILFCVFLRCANKRVQRKRTIETGCRHDDHFPYPVDDLEDATAFLLGNRPEPLPEFGALQLHVLQQFFPQFLGSEIEKRLQCGQGIPDLVRQSGGHDRKAAHPIGDDHALEDTHFFLEKGVPFQLDQKEFHAAEETAAQILQIPWFHDILEDRSRINRADRAVQIRICRSQHSHDPRLQPADVAEQVHSCTPGHALIGDEDPDATGLLLQYLFRFPDIRGGQDGEIVLECLPEVFQGFFFVVHVQNMVLPVIVHDYSSSARGRSNVTSVHSPSLLSMVIFPWWFMIMV